MTHTDRQAAVKMDEMALEQFADSLIKEKNSPYVTAENRKEIAKMLVEDMYQAINVKLLNSLSDEQVEKLNALLESQANEAAVGQFFEKNVPNIEATVRQCLLEFREGYLAVVNNPPSQ
ncbi:hypothetical protein HGB07_00180 [Candidatus Roizmanbacteria bacterium]|nr:hypothetical protein [Candidatus Roizmanbacteria bacterium]